MMIASLNTRVADLVSAKYRIAKVMNYHEDDFPSIIKKIKSHQDEIEIKLMDDVTHLPFGSGRKFTMIGIKPSEGNDNSVYERNDLMPGQQVNLSKWFNCEPVPGSEGSIQNSSNPLIKHCPVQGRNTTAAGAIVFDKVHNSAQAEDVAYELMNQFRRACHGDDKVAEADDQWLDVRYSRSSGYTLQVLSDHFSGLMLALMKVDTKGIKIDSKYGSMCKMGVSAARTHYLKMTKSGVGEETKGVMFGLPPGTTEKTVADAVLEIYATISSVSAESREGLGIPEEFPPVKSEDFEVQVKDGRFGNGEEYRMAFVTCPDVSIFDVDEVWRTSSIVSDRGKPSVLMKKKKGDKNKEKDENSASKSLRTELRFRDDECGEGEVDYDAEEVNFGKAGHAGTPLAYQKDVEAMKHSIDLLTKNAVAPLSKEDIQSMIAIGQRSAGKDTDGKLAVMKSSTLNTLEKINGAYGELVSLESERVRIFREAVTNLKDAILSTKIPDSQKEEMFSKVENMKEALDPAQKAEVTKMLEEAIQATHQNALVSAAGKVEEMAQVLERNAKESAKAREETATNVKSLMEAAGADFTETEKAGKKRAQSDVGSVGSDCAPRRPSKMATAGSPGRARQVGEAGGSACEAADSEMKVSVSFG